VAAAWEEVSRPVDHSLLLFPLLVPLSPKSFLKALPMMVLCFVFAALTSACHSSISSLLGVFVA
ncbi:MAG: hypothetical protein AAFP00_03600, partial [Bacteroidota bacterium]